MTDGGATRPRRAVSPDADESDDTPTAVLYTPRRGGEGDDAADNDGSAPTTDRATDDTPESTHESSGIGDGIGDTTVISALEPDQPPGRGSEASPAAANRTPESVWRPRPTAPGTPVPPPVLEPSSPALPSSASYQPRRSAASALSPAEPPEPGPKPKGRLADRLPFQGKDRFWPTFIGVAALVALLLIGGLVYSLLNPPANVAPTPVSSPSYTGAPAITTMDLVTPEDAVGLAEGESWYNAQTLTSLAAESPQPACLTAVSGSATPAISLQRTLAVEGREDLAMLHQLDYFTDNEQANTAFDERKELIAACNDTQALIASATTVSGIGDAALQVTVAYEGEITEYHTLLLVLSGPVLSTFDVAQAETPIEVDALVTSATAALLRSCETNGSCPSDPSAEAAAPPASSPNGWLTASDLPRVTPGSGRWTALTPTDITSPGTTCEDLSLSSVSGPTARQQRTFVLTQDPGAPSGFGADEMLFTFEDASAAKSFAATLTKNISGCGDKLLTAEVSDETEISQDVGDIAVTGTSFLVKQVVAGQETEFYYQVVVTRVDNHVAYFVLNTSKSFLYSTEQLESIGTRAAVRATQLA